MATGSYCPKCGAALAAGDTVCYQCGTPVTGASPPAPEPSWMIRPPASGGPAFPSPSSPPEYSYEQRRGIDRTKTGVALLAVGSALGWIPVISLLGGLLALVGAILVIMGREAFGPAHSRNVAIAIVLYLIGLFGVFILAAGLVGQIEAAVALPAPQVEGGMVDAFNTFLVGGIVVGIFSGLAVVLFLYALLDSVGKVLIWASFFASFGLLLFVWAVIIGQVGSATSAAFASSPPDLGPLLALDAQINALRLLDILPDLLMAAAAYVAWSRIDQGKIPLRSASSLGPTG